MPTNASKQTIAPSPLANTPANKTAAPNVLSKPSVTQLKPATTQGSEKENANEPLQSVASLPNAAQLRAEKQAQHTIDKPFQLKNKPALIQKKENKTGLPDPLKNGVENLSGFSLDDVKVHYNSQKPAQLQALAYAQGTEIHVAPGQERHLPHEAWHVVQQKQGRVRPTLQMKQGIAVNNDKGLEKEADEMGEKALATNATIAGDNISNVIQQQMGDASQKTVQRFWDTALYAAGTIILTYAVHRLLPIVAPKVRNFVSSKLAKEPEIVEESHKAEAIAKKIDKQEATKVLAENIKPKVLALAKEAESQPEEILNEIEPLPKVEELSKPEQEKIAKDDVVTEENNEPIATETETPVETPLVLEETVADDAPSGDVTATTQEEIVPEEVTTPVKKTGARKNNRKQVGGKRGKTKKKDKTVVVAEEPEEIVATPKPNHGFTPSRSQLRAAIGKTGKENEDLEDIGRWVVNESMWNGLTASAEAADIGINLAYSSHTAAELETFKKKEESSDYFEMAKLFVRLKQPAEKEKAKKEVVPVTKNTLSQVTRYWQAGKQAIGGALRAGTISATTSKSGGGMVLLLGLIVVIEGKGEFRAHLSLPPGAAGDGTFDEGHLKIEEGELLNQYFFAVGSGGSISMLANSPTVATSNPGVWSKLGSPVWQSVKNIVSNLAVGTLG